MKLDCEKLQVLVLTMSLFLAGATAMAEKVKPARFPIGFWSTGTPTITGKMIDDWAEAGITLTYAGGQNMKDVLDWAHKRDIQIIIEDSRSAAPRQYEKDEVPQDYLRQVQSLVADYGKHPAAFGFKISDEPDPRNFRSVLKCAKTASEVSENLHVVVNNFSWYRSGGKYYDYDNIQLYRDELLPTLAENGVDIVSYDCYWHMNPEEPGPGWELFFESLYNYGEFSRENGMDFWNICLATPHLYFKVSDEAAVRWQFNCSIAYGARGVFYYTFYTPATANFRNGPIDEFGYKTEKFDWLRRTHQRFLTLYRNLFLEIELKQVTQVGQVYGQVPVFEPDELITKVEPIQYTLPGAHKVDMDHPFIVSRFVGQCGEQYVMVVNNSIDKSIYCKIGFRNPAFRLFCYKPAYGSIPVPGPVEETGVVRHKDNCEVKVWLAPGQEILYRVESPK